MFGRPPTHLTDPGAHPEAMERVTVSREIDAPPDELRAAVTDVGAFMRAAGFDEVEVDGDRISITNHVGVLTIELDLRRIDDPDAALAYEQVDGIFETMETRYVLEPAAGGTDATATTEFALDASLVGPILDATIITRQRRRELNAQFDYLEERYG